MGNQVLAVTLFDHAQQWTALWSVVAFLSRGFLATLCCTIKKRDSNTEDPCDSQCVSTSPRLLVHLSVFSREPRAVPGGRLAQKATRWSFQDEKSKMSHRTRSGNGCSSEGCRPCEKFLQSKLPHLIVQTCVSLVIDTGWAQMCSTLKFKFNASVPYTSERVDNGEEPLGFEFDCVQTQKCLYFSDDELANLRGSAIQVAFPVFEDLNLPYLTPEDGFEIIDNAHLSYDSLSTMFIQGIGKYVGSSSIGAYRAIPHPSVSDIGSNAFLEANITYHISTARMQVQTKRIERWKHLGMVPNEVFWKLDFIFYPCSTARKLEVLSFPESTGRAFLDSAKVNGTIERMCNTIMQECRGEHQQYNSIQDCENYLKSLPDVDPICVSKFNSPFAAQGSSLLCKYLHHFMAKFEPQLHCYHAGKGFPDSNGALKCVPTECVDENTPSEMLEVLQNNNVTINQTVVNASAYSLACEIDERNEIAAATIMALPFCLIALAESTCNSNCTQAISTYLGRYAENGALCRCQAENAIQRTSALLEKMNIDPSVLINLCSGSITLFQIPRCLGLYIPYDCEKENNQYLSSTGCRPFDLEALEALFSWEWGDQARLYGRQTQSDLVASAECEVFTIWYKSKHDIEQGLVPFYVTKKLTPTSDRRGIREEILDSGVYIHPSLGRLEGRHDEVLKALKGIQIRGQFSNNDLPCWYETRDFDRLMSSRNPVKHDTESTTHLAARKFIYQAFPSLNTTEHALIEMIPELAANDDPYSIMKLDIARKKISVALFHSLLGSRNLSAFTGVNKNKLQNDVEDFFEAAPFFFKPKDFHLISGTYSLAAASLTRRYQIFRALQRIISEDEIQLFLNNSYFQHGINNVSIQEAYELVTEILVAGTGIIDMTITLIERVRRDYCEVIDYWRRDKVSFILEHSRLQTSVSGFVAKPCPKCLPRMYSLSMANVDPNAFEEPLRFNPNRSDLKNVLTWNFIEKDLEGNSLGTLRRSCPARQISVEFAAAIAPLFFPANTECHAGIPVRKSVRFESHIVDVSKENSASQHIEVLKAVAEPEKVSSPRSSFLFIMLHGTESPVSFAANLIRKIRDKSNLFDPKFEFWSVYLPGWGRGSRLESCRMETASAPIERLVRISHSEGYEKIFIIAHGISAIFSWYVVQNVEHLLEGFIVFGPHPASYVRHFGRIPFELTYLRRFMSPMHLLGLAFNNFERVFDTAENQTFWNSELENDFLHTFKRTGVYNIYCYYFDNFKVVEGFLAASNPTQLKYIDPDTHILLLSSDKDPVFTSSQYEHTLVLLKPKKGKILEWYEVRGSYHEENVYIDANIGENVDQILQFVRKIRLESFSVWSTIRTVPVIRKASTRESEEDVTLLFIVILASIVLTAGIIMDAIIGPHILSWKGSRQLWWLACAFNPVVGIAALGSKSKLGIIFATLALFYFGFPCIASNIVVPFVTARAGKLGKPSAFLQILSYGITTSKIIMLLVEIWVQFETYRVLPGLYHHITAVSFIILLCCHYVWILIGVYELYRSKIKGKTQYTDLEIMKAYSDIFFSKFGKNLSSESISKRPKPEISMQSQTESRRVRTESLNMPRKRTWSFQTGRDSKSDTAEINGKTVVMSSRTTIGSFKRSQDLESYQTSRDSKSDAAEMGGKPVVISAYARNMMGSFKRTSDLESNSRIRANSLHSDIIKE
eukprot:jgi/Bigna1/90432/estExt_fgenesh1_pg.C_700065